MKNNLYNRGISLMEILVVVTIFGALGIIVSSSIILTLQGSKKSEGVVAVRENLDYSLSIMERQIRNADSIPDSDCPGASPYVLNYFDQDNNKTSLSCQMGSSDSFVASGSGNLRITSPKVIITDCSIVCTRGNPPNPSYVDITLGAKSASSTGAQSSSATVSTRIYLRTY